MKKLTCLAALLGLGLWAAGCSQDSGSGTGMQPPKTLPPAGPGPGTTPMMDEKDKPADDAGAKADGAADDAAPADEDKADDKPAE